MTEVKLYLDGPIVSQVPCDEAGNVLPGPYAMLSFLQQQLEWQRPYDAVRLQINSPGGHVTEGFAIADWLRTLGVPVTTVAIGQCSSIATAPFLAGDTRLVHANTELLIHLPTGQCTATGADAAQAWANEMAACQQRLIDLYVTRAGVDAAEITALMAAETTLSAERARALGFATAVVEPITALAVLAPSSFTSNPAAPDKSLMDSISDLMKRMKTALNILETAAPKTALSIDTAGDSPITLTIDAAGDAYAVGDMVYTDAEMTVAAPDGDHVLSDDNTITVASGAITAITEPTTDAAKGVDADVATAIQQMAESITALAGELRGMKTAQATQAKAVTTLQGNYTALARGVKTNAASPPDAGKSNADDDTDKDSVAVAAERRAARRAERYK